MDIARIIAKFAGSLDMSSKLGQRIAEKASRLGISLGQMPLTTSSASSTTVSPTVVSNMGSLRSDALSLSSGLTGKLKSSTANTTSSTTASVPQIGISNERFIFNDAQVLDMTKQELAQKVYSRIYTRLARKLGTDNPYVQKFLREKTAKLATIPNTPLVSSVTTTTPVTVTATTTTPVTSKNTKGVIDVFTMDDTDTAQFKYDLDGNGTGATAHYLGVQTGLNMAAHDKAKLQVENINIGNDETANNTEFLRGLNVCLTKAKAGDIDAAYFALGPMIQITDLSATMTASEVAQASTRAEIRDYVMNYTGTDEGLLNAQKAYKLLDQIQQYVPVYISAGNSPNEVNFWAFAAQPNDNITVIGAKENYTSPVYDQTVQTFWSWKRIAGGWDLDNDGVVDRVLQSGDEGYDLPVGTVFNNVVTRIDGGLSLNNSGKVDITVSESDPWYALPIGTNLSVIGEGTSLGVGYATGLAIKNNQIKDRAT